MLEVHTIWSALNVDRQPIVDDPDQAASMAQDADSAPDLRRFIDDRLLVCAVFNAGVSAARLGTGDAL